MSKNLIHARLEPLVFPSLSVSLKNKTNCLQREMGKSWTWLKKKLLWIEKGWQLALMESEVGMCGACGAAYVQYRFCSRPNGIEEIFEGNPIT